MAGGETSVIRPSTSPLMPVFRSTDPFSPNEGTAAPVFASMATSRSPAPNTIRGAAPPTPAQYATPRRLTAAGNCDFQRTFPVSGSSAYTVDPAPTYMTPPTTIGVTWSAGLPVSKVHAV